MCYYTHFTDVDIEARKEVLGNSPKVLLLGSGRGSFCMLLTVIPLLALNLPIIPGDFTLFEASVFRYCRCHPRRFSLLLHRHLPPSPAGRAGEPGKGLAVS